MLQSTRGGKEGKGKGGKDETPVYVDAAPLAALFQVCHATSLRNQENYMLQHVQLSLHEGSVTVNGQAASLLLLLLWLLFVLFPGHYLIICTTAVTGATIVSVTCAVCTVCMVNSLTINTVAVTVAGIVSVTCTNT